jgi:hypothetical protein
MILSNLLKLMDLFRLFPVSRADFQKDGMFLIEYKY